MVRHAWLVCAVVVTVALVSCGKDSSSDSAKVPPKPSNGSPIAAEFLGFTEVEGGERGVRVRLYNFGDKKSASYMFLLRYYDEAGALLKVQEGTSFEKDHDFTSLSGGSFACEPKKHKELEIEMLEVPAEAARAEVLVSKVGAVADDGMTIEDWWSQESWSDWPEDEAAAEPGDTADDG